MKTHTWKLSLHKNAKPLVAEERNGPLETPCWIVTSHSPGSTGRVRLCEKSAPGVKHEASRLVYEREVGDIPEGLILCHKCDAPLCVNPDHLFVGTKKDNTQDMLSKKRHKYGESASWSKLTELSVLFVRSLRYKPGLFMTLGELLEVSESVIRDAYYGRSWRHLNGKQGVDI